ncbi:uncharacterized protein LOC125948687 isoform X1 [Anopheles darlingi]|uniref:uncharacterized protein LOC125948687 isoform X1 n=2 Tax=Anopheles darlingi TaxID=43151 RepID=UPI0021003F82|nr:uncharacterized protein LOC125948687 isoform X1 [Anopheles darlingi]XP_049530943.1 uncharacterized protein LOC125948687 isoform X1 [Anopheles darlingi]XP_049530944.1 uncharacterized protein LOC125948687 isoform X1 [Anopheles darlingi]
MDRSVDSIGSCSLDVDADSTDFSDTSGELNFLTPISGKDITREFTAGIKERCMIPVINCQAVTSVLDPVTGHISTVLTTTASPSQQAPVSQQQQQQQQQQQPLLGGDTVTSQTSKKPSYLNLACCVNGYSNLTTYDSKLRQDINKSREVSPSRPIIATLHYNRTESSGTGGGTGHLLTAPTLSYVSMNNTINNNYSGSTVGGTGQLSLAGSRMFKLNGSATSNGVGRLRGMNGTANGVGGGGAVDVTDNAACVLFNGNGSFAGSGLRSKVISSQSQISSITRDDPSQMTPKKSFIQQRVEKLYGATEGVVINKQIYSNSERKYLYNIANENNGTTTNGLNSTTTAAHTGKGHVPVLNGSACGAKNGSTNLTNGGTHSRIVDENNKLIEGDEQSQDDADVEALPVLRHLRPEFRAQLQIFSPKKIPKPSPSRSSTTTAAVNSGSVVHHTNGSHCGSSVEETLYSQTQSNTTTTGQYSSLESNLSDKRQEEYSLEQLSGETVRLSITTNGTMSTTTTTTEKSIESRSSEYHHYQETISHHGNDTSTLQHTVTDPSEKIVSSLPVVVPSPSAVGAADVDVSSRQQAESLVSVATANSATVPVDIVGQQQEETPTASVSCGVLENDIQQNSVAEQQEGIYGNDSRYIESKVSASDKKEASADGSVNGGDILNCDIPSVEQKRTVEENSMHTAMNGVGGVNTTMAADLEGISSSGKDITAKTTTAVATSNGNSVSSHNNINNNNNHELDGNYFLQILRNEQNRLQTMATEVENEMQQLKSNGVVLCEDINGYLLVAIGKARLLCSQKMKQFEGLCYTNLNQSPDEKFQTTGEDLRGFWDMVMLQVNDVDATYAEIDTFRKNGWKKPVIKSPPVSVRNGANRTTKLVKRPYKTATATTNGSTNGASTGSTTSAVNDGESKKASAALAAAKREAQRKQLLEMKRKQKLANGQNGLQAVEIFTPTVLTSDDGEAAGLSSSAGASTTTLVDTS